ncbi:MAG TPA: tRNA pseudouridine(38-40) synthase TruA [Rectinemataceae bacterium]|nr:tRNA pseudouridine(38-40) synthase TruA [Rectinemataceae bacterium]
MPRRNYLMRLAYDGRAYEGWQRLPDGKPSIQALVEKTLSSVLGEPVEVTGASRTDRGVHAEGQAASFHSRSPKPLPAILADLDRELPPDIVVKRIDEVDPRFHARFRAKSKLYRYRFHVGERPDPFLRPYSHHVRGPLDLVAMREAALLLVGEHDFAAFTNAKDAETRRSLDAIRVEEGEGLVDVFFEGKSFLYNQVRIMAAALLAAGEGRLSAAAIREALGKGDRRSLPGALGAWGLCLMEVRY